MKDFSQAMSLSGLRMEAILNESSVEFFIVANSSNLKYCLNFSNLNEGLSHHTIKFKYNKIFLKKYTLYNFNNICKLQIVMSY